MIRLVYAASYFEDQRATCGLVAYRLDYSSPQSFNRHVKDRLGLLASSFRQIGFEAMLDRFTTTLVTPHRDRLAHFTPAPQGITASVEI